MKNKEELESKLFDDLSKIIHFRDKEFDDIREIAHQYTKDMCELQKIECANSYIRETLLGHGKRAILNSKNIADEE